MKKVINYFDKNINRKSKIVDSSLQYLKGTKIPLPSLVEISDSGTCNRLCSFCPRSDPDYKDIKEFISEELHHKICSQLSELKYEGIVVYSGFNEPLLNKNIYKNVAQARKFLPNAKIEIITNGDVLNVERLKKLFSSGLSTILISVYDGPEDVTKFQKMCEEAALEKNQYVIRHRYLPPEKDFGITISNRGGQLEKAEHVIAPLKEPLRAKCNYPSYTFFLDYNGDVLMCSHDWGKKNILGNLKKQNFIDIWTSEKSNKARKKLFNSKRDFSPCNVCDAKGDLIGNIHSEAWREIL